MVGEKTHKLLNMMGIISIGDLRKIPCHIVEQSLGKNGLEIWKKANGIDSSPVKQYEEQQSLSKEHTFETTQ